MKEILILQNKILHYRVPFYNALSKHYKVTVLHSGKKLDGENEFAEIVKKVSKIGPFWIQNGVIDEVKDGRYAAIIAMFDIRWLANVYAVFKHSDTRFLYWGHRHSSSNIANQIRYYLMRKADGSILYGDGEINRMVNVGINRNSIFVADNTMDIPNAGNSQDKNRSSFLFVGRAQKRKKVDELINAFNDIKNQLPKSIRIDIVGEGEENFRLKELVKTLGLEKRVVFHGRITDHNKLKDLFHQALAYVSPGPVGLGVIHSFAYGIPVITRREEKHGPEFNHLRHLENAIIYDEYSELKHFLIELTKSEKSYQYGDSAFKYYSDKLTLKNMVKGFVSAIENRD